MLQQYVVELDRSSVLVAVNSATGRLEPAPLLGASVRREVPGRHKFFSFIYK
jgi:hypothetical protein